MSNLFKSRNVVCDNNEKKVIDYNSIISEKIMKIQESITNEQQKEQSVNFVEGITAETTLELLDDTSNEEVLVESQENLKAMAEEIINRASEDARAIIERAKQEADIVREDSAKIGREEGYKEGRKQAELEFDNMRKSLEEERLQMEIEYNERFNQMEPMLVDTILTVFEKVTHVLAEDKKDLVLQLVNDVLSKTEISKEFLIRVSGADYKFLLDNRERINGVVSNQVQIEIIEDPTFKKGQCMIESDSGIYDCSLDIQLDNLISAIKVMACLVGD